jgi:hypothetical protein
MFRPLLIALVLVSSLVAQLPPYSPAPGQPQHTFASFAYPDGQMPEPPVPDPTWAFETFIHIEGDYSPTFGGWLAGNCEIEAWVFYDGSPSVTYVDPGIQLLYWQAGDPQGVEADLWSGVWASPLVYTAPTPLTDVMGGSSGLLYPLPPTNSLPPYSGCHFQVDSCAVPTKIKIAEDQIPQSIYHYIAAVHVIVAVRSAIDGTGVAYFRLPVNAP